MKLEGCASSWSFIGYIKRGGNWVNIDDNEPMLWNTFVDGHPSESSSCIVTNGSWEMDVILATVLYVNLKIFQKCLN